MQQVPATLYCPRCDKRVSRDEFATVMLNVPAGFTRHAPAITVLKHRPCHRLVYVPPTPAREE